MRKIIALSLIILLIPSCTIHADYLIPEKENIQSMETITHFVSSQQSIEDAIVIPDNDPFFGIIGASMACWYDSSNVSGIKPLLVQNNGELTDHQLVFLDHYLTMEDKKILVLGKHLNTTYHTTELLGSPSEVAVEAARYAFVESSTVMIIPYGTDDAYKLSLIASPLASYLNIPVLIYDENENELQEICNDLNVRNGYLIGDILPYLPEINIIKLENEDEIQNVVLTTINEKFGEINYITMTNPSDVIPPYVLSTNETGFTDHITNTKLTFLGKAIDIKGEGIKNYAINIPSGINRIQIHANITESSSYFMDKIDSIVPIINLHLYDNQDNYVVFHCTMDLFQIHLL